MLPRKGTVKSVLAIVKVIAWPFLSTLTEQQRKDMDMRAKTVIMGLIAGIAGCATLPQTNQNHQLAAKKETWEECGERFVKEQEEKGLRETGNANAYFGANGTGLQSAIIDACGYEPSPSDMSSEMRDILNNSCVYKPVFDGGDSEAERSHFMNYADDSQIMKKVKVECERIYAANADRRKREDEEKAAALQAKVIEDEKRRAQIVIRIGSPEKDVYEKFGRPTDTNTNVGKWGVHKQLVYEYSDMYIYIENGYVSSWQN